VTVVVVLDPIEGERSLRIYVDPGTGIEVAEPPSVRGCVGAEEVPGRDQLEAAEGTDFARGRVPTQLQVIQIGRIPAAIASRSDGVKRAVAVLHELQVLEDGSAVIDVDRCAEDGPEPAGERRRERPEAEPCVSGIEGEDDIARSTGPNGAVGKNAHCTHGRGGYRQSLGDRQVDGLLGSADIEEKRLRVRFLGTFLVGDRHEIARRLHSAQVVVAEANVAKVHEPVIGRRRTGREVLAPLVEIRAPRQIGRVGAQPHDAQSRRRPEEKTPGEEPPSFVPGDVEDVPRLRMPGDALPMGPFRRVDGVLVDVERHGVAVLFDTLESGDHVVDAAILGVRHAGRRMGRPAGQEGSGEDRARGEPS